MWFTPNTDMYACRVDCATVEPGLQVCQESCVPVSPAMYDPWYARQFCHDPWAVAQPCCDYRPLRYGCYNGSNCGHNNNCGSSCSSCSSCCLLPKIRCGSAVGPQRTVVYTDANGATCRVTRQINSVGSADDAVSKYSPEYIARSVEHAAKKARAKKQKKPKPTQAKCNSVKSGKSSVSSVSIAPRRMVRLRRMRA